MNKLFSEFNFSASKAEWGQEVSKALKPPFTLDNLVWKSELGFEVPSYIKKADIADVSREVISTSNTTKIRQSFLVSANLDHTNAEILQALENGVESVHIKTDKLLTSAHWKKITDGLFLDIIDTHISFQNKELYAAGLKEWLIFSQQYYSNKELRGSITYPTKEKQEITLIFDILKSNSYTSFKTFEIEEETMDKDLHLAHFILFEGLQAGLSLEEMSRKIQFKTKLSLDFFTSIAKIKALRCMWNEILNGYGSNINQSAYIIATLDTHLYQTAENEVYNNLIKQTSQAISAFLGEADELEINSFDVSNKLNSTMSNRISRNILHILKEESFLDQEQAPLKGAYAIEEISKKIIETTWKNFLVLEQSAKI